MSKSTISTLQLFAMVPDADTARIYLEARLWPQGPTCPVCVSHERITARKGGFYRCNACVQDFTVRTGTIFERSHIPLHKWVYAMYLLLTARKGISSVQLAKEIGITQKSAWFMLQRLREACGGDPTILEGIVEVDETFVGGKIKNMHEKKRAAAMRSPDTFKGKAIVVGAIERGGRVKAQVVPDRSRESLHGVLEQHISPDSVVITDELHSYRGMQPHHEVINHADGYVRGLIHTNTIESVWALLKRGLHGVYHHASPKHLGRYVDEFTFRLNEGNVKHHTLARIDSMIAASTGRRLTYARLIA